MKKIKGCKNWEPEKCIRCGALYGASNCLELIEFETEKELGNYYKSKGGKGYYTV